MLEGSIFPKDGAIGRKDFTRKYIICKPWFTTHNNVRIISLDKIIKEGNLFKIERKFMHITCNWSITDSVYDVCVQLIWLGASQLLSEVSIVWFAGALEAVWWSCSVSDGADSWLTACTFFRCELETNLESIILPWRLPLRYSLVPCILIFFISSLNKWPSLLH